MFEAGKAEGPTLWMQKETLSQAPIGVHVSHEVSRPEHKAALISVLHNITLSSGIACSMQSPSPSQVTVNHQAGYTIIISRLHLAMFTLYVGSYVLSCYAFTEGW